MDIAFIIPAAIILIILLIGYIYESRKSTSLKAKLDAAASQEALLKHNADETLMRERQNANERIALQEKQAEALLNEQRQQYEKRLAEQERSFKERINAQEASFIERLNQQQEQRETRLKQQKEEVESLHKRMNTEFENISNRIFQSKTEDFTKLNSEHISNLLRPLDKDIKEFREKVEQAYTTEAKERHSLGEHIKELRELNNRLSEEANNLTRALKGDSKQQGNWGEMILERILQSSGLIEGEHYFRQEFIKDETGEILINEESGQRMQPDIIIRYPDDRDIIIDSKVSLTAYISYLSAEDDSSRAQYLKEHIASVRSHIDNLSSKSYDRYNIHSLDYVMLFIPNEPSYFVAMEADNSLWNYAYKKGVVLISPSNLISTLFVVNSLWTRERQQRDVQKIVDTANAIYDKFVNFTDNFTKIESSLNKAMDAYRDAYRQLTSGKGNITRRLEEIKRQGLLTTNKQLPDYFVEE